MKVFKAKRTLQTSRVHARRRSHNAPDKGDVLFRPKSREISKGLIWWFSRKSQAHYLCLAQEGASFKNRVGVTMLDGRPACAFTKCLVPIVGYPTAEQVVLISKEIRIAMQRVKLVRLRKGELGLWRRGHAASRAVK